MSARVEPAIPSRPKVRAFLSHSSVDNQFVRVVANQLGRRRVAFDEVTFETGTALLESIRKALAGSDCFVLFASRASLESLWVKFEISEAEELLRATIVRSAIVLIIDREVSPHELPAWMQRSLVERVLSPRAAARLIEHQLNKLRGLEESQLFIGRESLLSEFSDKLIPTTEDNPPHVLIAGGLTGVGRRTFLRRSTLDFLSMRAGPVFTLQATDGMEVLHLQLLDELCELDERSQVQDAIQQFQRAEPADRSKTIAQLIASVSLGNVVTMIVDEGSLLDANSRYTPEAIGLLQALKSYPSTIVGLVMTKRPDVNETILRDLEAVFIRVPALDTNATQLLVTQALRRAGIPATSGQITELAQYIDGYPPAVNLAVSSAQQYGLETLLADKSGLVDYKIRTFAGVLSKLGLDDEDWNILRVLASQTALPLEALAVAAGIEEEALARRLRRLIDSNVILPSGNMFEIALPIRSAVYSSKGGLSDNEFAGIASRLKSIYWTDPTTVPPLEVIAATVHAVSRSNVTELAEFRGMILPSVLYKAAKEQYDKGGQESWENADQLLDQLLKVEPKHKQGLVLCAKVAVRLREWDRARKMLEIIRQLRLPEHYYLTAFLYWKKREYATAVESFRLAIATGHQSPEVYHRFSHLFFSSR